MHSNLFIYELILTPKGKIHLVGRIFIPMAAKHRKLFSYEVFTKEGKE